MFLTDAHIVGHVLPGLQRIVTCLFSGTVRSSPCYHVTRNKTSSTAGIFIIHLPKLSASVCCLSNPSQLDVIKRDTATNELYMILKDIVMLNDSDWKKKEYLFDNTRYNKFKINKTISFNSNKFLTFKEFLIIDDFKIVIYGAGNYGKKTSEFLDNVKISDYIFVDQNYKKVNSIFCGKKIYAVNKLLEIDKKYMKYIVIVSINDDEEVLEVYKKLLWLNNCKIMSYRDLILYNKISKE